MWQGYAFKRHLYGFCHTGGKLIPIEVKLSATPRPAMANAILKFREGLPEKAGPGYVIHPGGVRLPLRQAWLRCRSPSFDSQVLGTRSQILESSATLRSAGWAITICRRYPARSRAVE